MLQIDTIPEFRTAREGFPAPVVLVPTMGALHAGHASLVSLARAVAGEKGTVVVSVFVNPAQFGEGEDLESYPRTLEDDLDLCAEAGGDVLFAPAVSGMYWPDASTCVTENALSRSLCGASRPGHFAGVSLVVAKLFNIVTPDGAVFGKKDYQQLAVVRRLVRDLDFPVEIHAGETVRENDGLALSSRNRYLTPDERAQAPAVARALATASGSADPVATFCGQIAEEAPLGTLDYAELVDRETLEPLTAPVPGGSLLAVAVHFGRARLIDNIEL